MKLILKNAFVLLLALVSVSVTAQDINAKKNPKPKKAKTAKVDAPKPPKEPKAPKVKPDYSKIDLSKRTSDHFMFQFGSANWGLFEILFRGGVVVGSDRCFIPEVIKHGKTGLLCQYDDVQGWVAAVDRLLSDESERERLSIGAIKDMQARYSVPVVAKRYLSIFEAAVSTAKAVTISN